MHVIVTGGAGYIGSHTLLTLIEAGHQVTVIDNLVNSSAESLRRVEMMTGARVPLMVEDVRDGGRMMECLGNLHPDAVIHFAGLKSVAESVSDPAAYYATNVQGAVNVAEAAGAAGARALIFSSSATVYGQESRMPVSEDSETGPINPYGRSKLFAEAALKDVQLTHPELSLGILRYFNPVGAHESGMIGEDPTGKPANLMPYLARVAAGMYPFLQIFGDDYETRDGTGIRDYIHVVDLAEAHLATVEWLLQNPGVGCWNVGRGIGISVAEMVKAFEDVTGAAVPTKVVGRRPGDVAESYADVTAITQQVGWEARRGLEDMVRDLWRWQELNPRGFSAPLESGSDVAQRLTSVAGNPNS
jgi:UDP-glucose 4-epimerase